GGGIPTGQSSAAPFASAYPNSALGVLEDLMHMSTGKTVCRGVNAHGRRARASLLRKAKQALRRSRPPFARLCAQDYLVVPKPVGREVVRRHAYTERLEPRTVEAVDVKRARRLGDRIYRTQFLPEQCGRVRRPKPIFAAIA